jgi:hypothetical protein
MRNRAAYPEDLMAAEDTNGAAESLEHRVRRLEDAVAALQDTGLMEDRIVHRLLDRTDRGSVPTIRLPEGEVIEPTAALPPARPAETFPGEYELAPPPPSAEPVMPPAPGKPTSRWLLIEMLREARAMLHMHFDPRFRMSWYARTIPPVLLGLMVFSGYLFNGFISVPVVSPLIDKAFVVVAALVAYKILTREVARYHDTIAALTHRR